MKLALFEIKAHAFEILKALKDERAIRLDKISKSRAFRNYKDSLEGRAIIEHTQKEYTSRNALIELGITDGLGRRYVKSKEDINHIAMERVEKRRQAVYFDLPKLPTTEQLTHDMIVRLKHNSNVNELVHEVKNLYNGF